MRSPIRATKASSGCRWFRSRWSVTRRIRSARRRAPNNRLKACTRYENPAWHRPDARQYWRPNILGFQPANRCQLMPVVNRVADFQNDIAAWRQDIHANPELLYDVHRTAGLVADKLREFGCDEVVTGLGQTGVVGVIKGRKPTTDGQTVKTIGMRADMDALPVTEITNLPYASKTSGKMHACGHDGHTAMLLGAARYLAETRNFAGDAVVIFQPAEEGGAGAAAMIKDGLMDRFKIEQVFGMHNTPGLPVGSFAIRPGPMMAATAS